jgi:hypothetical protein
MSVAQLGQKTFFHCCSILLEPGAVILPGNWGRCIRLLGWAHNLALREIVFEDMRVRSFQSLPSRMDAVFFMPSMEHAQLYQSRNALMNIYEIELLDSNATTHVGDWRLAAGEGVSGPLSLHWVENYWQGVLQPPLLLNNSQVQSVEILAESPIRILKRY